MKAPWSGQLSAAQTGWLVMLLFFGWLGYLLVPVPKPEPPPPPAPVKLPPSRLVALGLPDNPDLEHLPEYFALYADQAEWKDDKTIFAYWNPGSNSYSYFFEAMRTNGKSFFHPISKFEAYKNMSDEENLEYELDDYVPTIDAIAALKPISDSLTHPIVLFRSRHVVSVSTYRPGFGGVIVPSNKTNSVPIDLRAKAQPLPKIQFEKLPVPDEPTKK